MSTDQELFDAISSGTTAQDTPAAVAEPSEAQPAVARDDGGRFAARQADEAQPEPTQAEQPAKPEPSVPPGRLREEAEARRNAERERDEMRAQLRLLMDMQKPQAQPAEAKPAPEIWDNPDQWVDDRLGSVKTEVQQTREYFSRLLAEQAHGADKVTEAYQALDAAIRNGAVDGNAVKAQLAKSMNPYGDIMGWHAKHSIMSEIGNDPKAYEQKIIERYLASQQPQTAPAAAQAAPGATIVKLPPNLNRMTSASSDASGSNDVSDQELFHATTSRRR